MKANQIINKIALFFMLGTVGVFSSCQDWLNISPKTDMKIEELFKNEVGFNDVLTGVYAYMTKEVLYGQNLSYGYLDVMAQYYDSPRLSSGVSEHLYSNAISYNYTEYSEESRINSIWSTAYKSIINLNLGIEYINKSRHIFKNEDTYNIYRGEYYALRGMIHFDLLRLFAPSPKMNDGNGLNAKAIPYVDAYTKNPQPQLTVKEVLDRVIADLKMAKEIMAPSDPFGPINPTRPDNAVVVAWRTTHLNYYAVSALLARVYLYAGKNDLALAEAKSIIGEPENQTGFFRLSTSLATDIAPLFDTEIIFCLEMIDLNKQMENVLVEVGSKNSSNLSMSRNMQIALFSENPGDVDFRINWLKPNSIGNYMLQKYIGMNKITLITLPELYLIAAECAVPSEGLKYLNKLYFNRGKGPCSSDADLKKEIYKEYAREMIGNGQMFFYYKRNAAPAIGIINATPVADLNAIYNLPIPKKELEVGNIAK